MKPKLPTPPKGYRLIATREQKRQSSPKMHTDIWWNDAGLKWCRLDGNTHDGTFYEFIYARKISPSGPQPAQHRVKSNPAKAERRKHRTTKQGAGGAHTTSPESLRKWLATCTPEQLRAELRKRDVLQSVPDAKLVTEPDAAMVERTAVEMENLWLTAPDPKVSWLAVARWHWARMREAQDKAEKLVKKWNEDATAWVRRSKADKKSYHKGYLSRGYGFMLAQCASELEREFGLKGER